MDGGIESTLLKGSWMSARFRGEDRGYRNSQAQNAAHRISVGFTRFSKSQLARRLYPSEALPRFDSDRPCSCAGNSRAAPNSYGHIGQGAKIALRIGHPKMPCIALSFKVPGRAHRKVQYHFPRVRWKTFQVRAAAKPLGLEKFLNCTPVAEVKAILGHDSSSELFQ